MQSIEEIRGILLQTLKKIWGYDTFRDVQEEIIFSVIERKDTLVLLPTGGGKSLCYQLPALVMEGVCLVISPLVALMKDQVFQLQAMGIEAEYLSAELDEMEQEIVYEKVIRGDVKILYVSPERLSNSVFLRKIMEVGLSFIAVDEAHCISEWGQDFRPSYQHIKTFRKIIGKLPCLALTATATPKVVADIKEKLDFEEIQIFQKSYRRENLKIFTEEISDKYQRILNFLRYNSISGIIYVRMRRDAEELAQFLKRRGLKNVDFYHAGLSVREKNEKQRKWQWSSQEVLIATNAFGMGIDKDNVGFVIHFSPSVSLENYYQEIGRAGRDGKEGSVFLLWNEQELEEIDDILYQQISNKTEFLKIVHSLYSKFQIAEAENSDVVFQLDLSQIQKSTRLSYAKIRNVLNFLHNQEVIHWNNNYNTSSTIELKLSPGDLEYLPPKESYFVEILFRNLAGVRMGRVSFNEKKLSNKFGISQEDVQKRILSLEKKGFLEYISGNQDSVKFIAYRDDRWMGGKMWKLFEQIQKNKLQKWEEMKYFIKNKDFCKMKLILAYFGEKKAENCGKCSVCLGIKGREYSLEEEILDLLRISPMSLDELRTKKYELEKEVLLESIMGLLNLEKIRMLNYKTYMINE